MIYDSQIIKMISECGARAGITPEVDKRGVAHFRERPLKTDGSIDKTVAGVWISKERAFGETYAALLNASAGKLYEKNRPQTQWYSAAAA